ncbi:MAG TPA: SDR family oxidoreductase [Acidobacteriaceae bacterium]
MNMTGNTILITGGTSGIGRALAEAFHKLGNQVIIAGRRKPLLDEVAAANPGMQAAVFDVQDAASVADFGRSATAQFPALNILINNAGIMKSEDLNDSSADFSIVESTVATNLIAPLRLTAALLPLLKRQPHAAVMTVSSGLAFVPLAMTPTYCATKAAMHSWTQSLRYQLQGSSVQVMELIPPYVQTELQGAHQAQDPRAMPLADFIAEVMEILRTQTDAQEICVERVYPLRFAAEKGQAGYGQVFKGMNDSLRAAMAGHERR